MVEVRPTIRPASLPILDQVVQPQREIVANPTNVRTGTVDWVPDGPVCSIDPKHEFCSVYRRRHHCRACGLVICSSCSTGRYALSGFGFAGAVLHRICISCVALTTDNLGHLAHLWQTAANKNATAADLASAMLAVHDFGFARIGAPNWRRLGQRLKSLLDLEVDTCQLLLDDLVIAGELSVEQIDVMALSRAQRLADTLRVSAGLTDLAEVPIAFTEALQCALKLRAKAEQRDAVADYYNLLMALVRRPFDQVTSVDIIDAWGRYQEFAHKRHQVVPASLETQARDLLNRAIRRDQTAACKELELAFNSRSFVQIQKAMTTSDSVLSVLSNSPYRDYVVPDVKVVIPGFASYRRSAGKLIEPANASNHQKWHERQLPLYPPRRI